MAVDLAKVRERMVDLEDHHEAEVNVEQVLAMLLDYPDAERLGASLQPELTRALRLFMRVYVTKLGLPPTAANAIGVGFVQGVTFTVAYQQIKEEG
jgi:hypothetical protein